MKGLASVLFVMLTILFLASGCAQLGTAIAPSNIPLAPGSYQTIGPVKGESCLFSLLAIIPLGEFSSMEAAMKDALSQSPDATALVGVTADVSSYFLIIGNLNCTTVHATAVKGT